MTEPSTTPCTDPVVEAVVAKLRDRSAVGLKKYGTTLASSPEGTLDFLRHAQAEMLDGANYLEWLIQQVELMAAAMSQPAEGEEIMVNTPYDVFILPLRPSGLDGNGPRFVVHVPGPEAQQQQGQAVDCHCATCTCAPGMTPAVQETIPLRERILRRKSVEKIVGLRGGSLDRLIHAGAFPRPFKLNPADPRSRAIGWHGSDVAAWIDQRREEQARQQRGGRDHG